jgi:hypothetical protein
MKNRSKQLIAFYTENGADHAGRIWEDIYGFSDEELESTHDYIQWLFPTITPSAFNSNAVLLDAGLVYQLSQSAVFNLRFNKSLERILDFWGLSIQVISILTKRESLSVRLPMNGFGCEPTIITS